MAIGAHSTVLLVLLLCSALMLYMFVHVNVYHDGGKGGCPLPTEQPPSPSFWLFRQTGTTRKMAAAVLLLLLSAGALLYSTEAQEAYNRLPGDYRKGVGLVLNELSSYPTVRLHFLFFKTVQKLEIEVVFF